MLSTVTIVSKFGNIEHLNYNIWVTLRNICQLLICWFCTIFYTTERNIQMYTICFFLKHLPVACNSSDKTATYYFSALKNAHIVLYIVFRSLSVPLNFSLSKVVCKRRLLQYVDVSNSRFCSRIRVMCSCFI